MKPQTKRLANQITQKLYLPWEIVPTDPKDDDGYFDIITRQVHYGKYYIAESLSKENAEFILEAVNSRENNFNELISGLARLASDVEGILRAFPELKETMGCMNFDSLIKNKDNAFKVLREINIKNYVYSPPDDNCDFDSPSGKPCPLTPTVRMMSADRKREMQYCRNHAQEIEAYLESQGDADRGK